MANEAQVVDAIRNAGHEFVFTAGHGLTRAERRRGRNLDAVQWAIAGPDYIWTPAQRQAVDLFYGLGIPPARAARLLNVTRQAFNARLTAAERSAHRWYDSDRRPRFRDKKGRPDAQMVLDGTEQPQKVRRVPWLGAPDPEPKPVPIP